jgi:hypothetical protein
VNEVFVVLECDASSLGIWIMTFRNKVAVSPARIEVLKTKMFFLDISVFEDETATLSQNVVKQKPSDEASHPRRTDTLTITFSRNLTPLSLNIYLFFLIYFGSFALTANANSSQPKQPFQHS